MKYLKPQLRTLIEERNLFCSIGSSASGSVFGDTHCNIGGSPDLGGSIGLCENGNADSNFFLSNCTNGTSVANSSCSIGNSPN